MIPSMETANEAENKKCEEITRQEVKKEFQLLEVLEPQIKALREELKTLGEQDQDVEDFEAQRLRSHGAKVKLNFIFYVLAWFG